MFLMIELPREGEGCNPNRARCLHRFAQAADAKHARTVGRLYAQQAMRRKGVERGAFCPKVAVLVTFWRGHDIDVDNAAACIKAYQDGIFDALGANDREVLAILSAKVHTEDKAKHRCKELWLFDEADKAQNLMQSVLVDAMRAAKMRKGGEA